MSSETNPKQHMVSRTGSQKLEDSPIKRNPAFIRNLENSQIIGYDDNVVEAIFSAVHDKSRWYDVLSTIVARHELLSAYFLHRDRQSKSVIVEYEYSKLIEKNQIRYGQQGLREMLIENLSEHQFGRFRNLDNHNLNSNSKLNYGPQAYDHICENGFIAGCHLSCPVNELFVWVQRDEVRGPLEDIELDQLSSYIPLFRGSLTQLAKVQEDRWKLQCLSHVIDNNGIAVFLVDGAGRVQHRNKQAGEYVETGVINSGDAMVFKNQNDSERYGAGLKTLFENDLFERAWEDLFLIRDDFGIRHTVKLSPYFCDGNWRSPVQIRSHIVTIQPMKSGA